MIINSYILSSAWFEFVANNPTLVKPVHGCLMHWCSEKNNILKWAKEFQLPTEEAMAMTGISDKHTFLKALKQLEEFGLIRVVQESKNMYTARFVSFYGADLIEAKLEFYRVEKSHATTHATLQGTTHATAHATTHDTTTATTTNNKLLKDLNNKTNKHIGADPSSKIFKPPVVEEVIAYFTEHGYRKEVAVRAFAYYETADWHDSKGNKVKNWKQKLNANWFKDENRIKQAQQRRFVQ